MNPKKDIIAKNKKAVFASEAKQSHRNGTSLRGGRQGDRRSHLPGAATILLGLLMLAIAGCASTTATTGGGADTDITAAKTQADLNIDGVFSETAWDNAEETTVELEAEDGVEAKEITLKALYDEKNVYIQASYKDATPKKMNEAWVYDGAKWQKGSYDDTLAFVFDIDGSVKDFASKGMGVMTKPLKNGMDVFDFTLEASAEQPSTGCLDFWGW